MPKHQVTIIPGAFQAGAYSQGIRGWGFVFVSDQGPREQATGKIAETIEEQTAQTLENVKIILAAGDTTVAGVIKVSTCQSDMALIERCNKIHAICFPYLKPARTTVGSMLNSISVRVDAIASVGKE